MKKFLTVLLTLCLLFSFTACGNQSVAPAVDMDNMTEFEQSQLEGYHPVTAGARYEVLASVCDNASYFESDDTEAKLKGIVVVRIEEEDKKETVKTFKKIVTQIAEKSDLLFSENLEGVLVELKTEGDLQIMAHIAVTHMKAGIIAIMHGATHTEPDTETAQVYRDIYRQVLDEAGIEKTPEFIELNRTSSESSN